MKTVGSKSTPIGWEAVDFRLKDTSEKEYSLKDFSSKKGLLLVFSCNHCPYAKAAWPLLVDLYQKYGNNIGFVAINSNDSVSYPEDAFEVMKQRKNDWQIPFPYLRDKSQATAKAYDAQCTPDPYLFTVKDGKFSLFYRGRINDNWQNPDRVKERNLEEAIKLLIAGKPSLENQPAAMGCSIKWKE